MTKKSTYIFTGFLLLILILGIAGAKDNELKLIRIRTPHLELARELSEKGFDIAGINRHDKWIDLVVSSIEEQEIKKLGYRYELIEYSHPLGVGALSDYTDPAEISAFLDQVQANYPAIAKKILVKGPLYENQNIYAMKISDNVNQDEDEPVFILDAQHHAREVMTTEVAIDMIDYLTSRYSTDPQVKNWVDNIEIWVIPSINPDGSNYVFTVNNMWRKNRDPVCQVDLNRNYSFYWNGCGGSSGSCSSDTYRGPSAESELETQGFVALINQIHPIFSLSYHSYGEYIMWAYGCGDSNEDAALFELGSALNNILENDNGQTGQYAIGDIYSTIYPADGNSVDDIYGENGTFSYVIEVNSSSFQPDYQTWRNITVQRQRKAWQFFLDHALNTPSIQGHVRDAVSQQPLQANVDIQEIVYTHGEFQRKSEPTYGRYFRLTQSNKDYHITFSKAGYISRTFLVHVGTDTYWLDVDLIPLTTSSAQYVVGSAQVYGNPTNGDNDAYADNCETATAKVSIKSVGTGTAENVQVSISTTSPFINITTPMPIQLGNIPTGQTVDTYFTYTIGTGANKAACNELAHFNISVIATGQPVADQNTFELANEIDLITGNKLYAFEPATGLEGWTVQQGTWALSSARVNPGGSTRSVHSSQYLDGQCDVLLSPEVEGTASTQLIIPNWYSIEPQSTYWYDRANVHIVQGANRTLISPVSGKLYQTGTFYNWGSNCQIGTEAGWSGDNTGNFWGNSTFNLSSYAGQKFKIEIRYMTDPATNREGVYIDDVQLTNIKYQGCDQQSDICAAANPPGKVLNNLMVSKSGGNPLLSWQAPNPSCSISAYGIYRGNLPITLYNHSSISCSITSTSFTDTTATGNHYYLIVPYNSSGEGSYGTNSNGTERPQGTSPCNPSQNLNPC